MFNKRHKIGILCGAGTRFASWFYAMIGILHLKDALLATIHTAEFKEFEKNDETRAVIFDIPNPQFFKALYVML